MPKNVERNRGVITKRAEGKYLVRVYSGLSPAGKRVYSSKIVNGTYLQCQRELTKMLGAKDTGTFTVPTKVTVGAYLTQWMATKVGVAERTKRDYQEALDHYILPALGHKKLTKLTRAEVQAHYNTLSATLSPRTVQKAHTVFSQAMSFAVQEGALTKSPCEYTERKSIERKAPTIFSAANVQLFLERTSNDPTWGAVWFVALTTGMRPQEYLALQWSDLDIEKRQLSVTRALREGKVKGQYEASEEMKTDGSKRVISLGAHTVAALLAHKKRAASLGGWMFPNAVGQPYTPRDARRHSASALKGIPELPKMKLYNTRHTHFSHLLGNGVDVKSAQQRGGWSSAVQLLDTYATSIPKVQEEMADISDSLVFPKMTKEG